MTAVMSRPATRYDSDLYTWVLSVQDGLVHALAEPRDGLVWGNQATRCGWQLIALPLTVARRGDVCARCMAGGVELLDLLPDHRR